MDNIRQSLGVCPQHDIIFPFLTVREHLEFYAGISLVVFNAAFHCVDAFYDARAERRHSF